MPNLVITIDEQVWPTVVGVLAERHGPPPEGLTPQAWASGIAAEVFKAHLADALEPPAVPAAPRRRSKRLGVRGY